MKARGRPAVARPRRRQSDHGPAPWSAASILALPAFIAVYAAVTILWKPPLGVAAWYAAASLATFVMYAIDKSAATRGDWRTKESTLHLLALAGGWPGALLAQQLFRHKSAKAQFRSVFWVTVVLNVATFVAICSPSVRSVLALHLTSTP